MMPHGPEAAMPLIVTWEKKQRLDKKVLQQLGFGGADRNPKAKPDEPSEADDIPDPGQDAC